MIESASNENLKRRENKMRSLIAYFSTGGEDILRYAEQTVRAIRRELQ